MIKANDLRIGNWVSLKCLVHYVPDNHSPHQINIHNLGSIAENNTEWEFLPISLTPEILEKCGFEKILLDEGMLTEGPLSEYYYLLKLSNNKYCNLSLISGYKNGFMEVTLFPYEDNFRYRYLHQLQNLYYALTKEELEVKL